MHWLNILMGRKWSYIKTFYKSCVIIVSSMIFVSKEKILINMLPLKRILNQLEINIGNILIKAARNMKFIIVTHQSILNSKNIKKECKYLLNSLLKLVPISKIVSIGIILLHIMLARMECLLSLVLQTNMNLCLV